MGGGRGGGEARRWENVQPNYTSERRQTAAWELRGRAGAAQADTGASVPFYSPPRISRVGGVGFQSREEGAGGLEPASRRAAPWGCSPSARVAVQCTMTDIPVPAELLYWHWSWHQEYAGEWP
uniref:Uncharacterized protein n=1 Tax=Sphaerodactylus townsendi TaxID=933632 RepID=A0ACB8EHM8_9SAUR